jgi:predicted AAA+ superfamily ATPase
MRPMSLYESGESNGLVSLKKLFKNSKTFVEKSTITIDDIAYLICRGGWPGSLDLDKKSQLQIPKDLLNSIITRDSKEIDGISKDIKKCVKLFKVMQEMFQH